MVKLPIDISTSYLEKSAKGIKYDIPETPPKPIWDPDSGRLSDPKEILEGIRVRTNTIKMKQNQIIQGQVVEANGRIFMGFKDGTVKTFKDFVIGKDPDQPENLKKPQPIVDKGFK